MDASTRSSPSGTSMSISSNSKLKAALTWAGQTRPAAAWFSRPTRLSSSRSARVILIRRWQPGMAHLTGTFLGIPPNFTTTARGRGSAMRAGCSASTFILVAVWEQSLHPGSPGHRLANREGPLNAENALRTTGLLTGGRKPGDRTGPVCQRLKSKGCNVTFEGQLPPRPLDCGLGPLPHGVIHLHDSAAWRATSAGSAETSSPACKRLVVGHRPSGGGGESTPAATSSSRPFRTAQITIPVSNGRPLCPECGKRRS